MFPFRDHNHSNKTPYVTYGLIILNCLIFFSYWDDLSSYPRMSEIYGTWALTPIRINYGYGYETLITSAFLHGGIMHLVGNMLFLHIYGDNLEDEMGHIKFLIFYLLCAVSAGIVQIISAPLSEIPVVGASGAVAGVMGGYLLLYPKAKIDVLLILLIYFRVFSVSAWIVLGIWFGLQLLNGALVTSATAGVAYWAHVGGFITGFALCVPLFLKLGGSSYWALNQFHPPHPKVEYRFSNSRIPKVKRLKKR